MVENIAPVFDAGEGGGKTSEFDVVALEVLRQSENVAEIAGLIQYLVDGLKSWAAQLGDSKAGDTQSPLNLLQAELNSLREMVHGFNEVTARNQASTESLRSSLAKIGQDLASLKSRVDNLPASAPGESTSIHRSAAHNQWTQ